MTTMTKDQFIEVLKELFSIQEVLTAESDLSLYIKDSIDLGELVAVLKEEHGVTPQDLSLFKIHSRLEDVWRIFNHEY
jgi:acyl carrier protein